MKTHLFLMTQIFPFGKGETFLEAELPIIAQQFDRVHLISENLEDTQTRPTPDNVEIHRFTSQLSTFQKLTSFTKISKPEVAKELSFIFKSQSPSNYLSCIKVLFDSVQQSEQTTQYLLNLVRQFDNEDEKLVFYSYWLTNNSLALANLKRVFPKAICISRAHRWDIYFDFHAPPYLPLKKHVIKNLDKVYSISEDGQQYLETFNEDTTKSTIDISRLGVFNHFDVNANLPSSENKVLKIVSCASVIQRKRVHLIMEAIELLRDDLEINWHHIGDGPLLEGLKEQADALMKKKPKVLINFLGYMPNQKALEFYASNAIDLFVNTSDSEGIPVSIMEAMSFYIPSAGTEVGGVAEIIESGFNGYLLSPNPLAQEIADCFLDYFQLSETEKMQLRRNARQTWEEKYNAAENYASFSRALLSL
ncbi:MAG: glycosyltransferase involved in cell wall biosynthesis [Ulvibacter sp.]|jgi:glycosyltransferase involved in cell wall biosynthesis